MPRRTMDPELSVATVDDIIASTQNYLPLFPRSHHIHIGGVHILAMTRFARYKLSQQREDLDKSVSHFTEAIFLPPVPQAGAGLNTAELLFHLALALLRRSEDLKQPDGVKYSIEYLRYLRGLPLESFDIPKNHVTTSLIRSLTIQVRLEAGDGTQSIEEMVDLCRELLTSHTLADFPIGACISLGLVSSIEFLRTRSIQLLDKVIECLRDAVRVCPPGSYDLLLELAFQLLIRFSENYSNGDYEEAIALLERVLDPNQPGERLDSIRGLATSMASLLTHVRSVIFGNPEYAEIAISRLRAALYSYSTEDVLRFPVADSLSIHLRQRFKDYSLAESLVEANSYLPQVVDLSSSRGQEAMCLIDERLSTSIPSISTSLSRQRELENLKEIEASRTSDISDIEESITHRRRLLNATPSNHPESFTCLAALRSLLHLAFSKTSKINYLEELIIVYYDILKLENGQHLRFYLIKGLVSSLCTRSQLLGRREDLHEVIRLMSLAVVNQYGKEPDRFRLSCEWAFLARSIRHPSILKAYKNAMSLIQSSLSFSPTVSTQHTRLVAMGKNCQTTPLDYASYQIELGQFEEAIETLEQGRALLWSEMRSLQIQMPQFVEEDSPLAKRFAEINQELEALTISVTPSGRPEMDDGAAQGGDWSDAFGRLVVRQRKLVEERDALILQIQGRPDSEGFLTASSFSFLRSAAKRGPVILINHSMWRSDILILLHGSAPLLISTPDDFYDRAIKLRDRLAEAREAGLDSGKYQRALRSVLRDLYELVGQPVIEMFQESGVPEQSRIWWCPTSVFCSLPLHAMGPIPSDHIPKLSKPSKRYFSDIYIPSYTPSLSALIESRNPSARALERPSFLLVAQPDASLPGVWGEIQVMHNLNVPVTSLISKWATPSSVVEGLRANQFAHFACHGNLVTGKPFDASFQLHGGKPLTLLDIVKSRLPNAEFAFLSCCHTAEITEESVADEALHLTAAMQYCGFRSVVGTMWAMADTDGRDLAEIFYTSLFSSQEHGVPYHERSARALRDATRQLRRKEGITLERWVNFVHYGA